MHVTKSIWLISFLLAIALIAGPSAAAEANPAFDKGMAAYQEGDTAQALAWFQKAASAGHPAAQGLLGYFYLKGLEVPRDYAKAAYWFGKAAAQGEAMAQYHLGALYERGKGVAQDYARAAQWYQEAIAQGEARSMFRLGLLHDRGQGVPQDLVQAYKWFNLAIMEGNREAVAYLESATRRMTPAQVAEAKRLAMEWITRQGGKP